MAHPVPRKLKDLVIYDIERTKEITDVHTLRGAAPLRKPVTLESGTYRVQIWTDSTVSIWKLVHETAIEGADL